VPRALLNLVVDVLAAALLTAMVGTGYILWFALPPGTNRTHMLWGLLRHQWGAVHFWLSATLLAVLAVHVALHWRWLLTGLSRRFGIGAWAERSPHLAGVVLLAVAAAPLTALAIAAQVSVRTLDRPLHPLEDGSRGVAPAPRSRSAPRPDAPPRSLGPGADTGDATTARAATVLAERCAPCHGAREPAAGVRADTPEALRRASAGTQWVVPGRPDESRLFEVVATPSLTRPVPSRHRLSANEVDALRAWIASLKG
jgi:mono/diheme cytochrome c family protein